MVALLTLVHGIALVKYFMEQITPNHLYQIDVRLNEHSKFCYNCKHKQFDAYSLMLT